MASKLEWKRPITELWGVPGALTSMAKINTVLIMIPVVISGGVGTRLWPVSRANFPKQFCELLDESLLSKTVRRLQPLGQPWMITTHDFKVLTERLYRELGLLNKQLLFEPMGRNTAPAIAFLCRVMEMRGLAAEVVGVFPADHLILKQNEFLQAVRLAEKVAALGTVVTLGITPSYPATGYGYIETAGKAQHQDGDLGAWSVKGFREKPDLENAKKFVAQGNFFWNAGIFVFKVESMIANFKKYMPELWAQMLVLKEDLSNLAAVYGAVKGESIDYGVMEKLENQVCIPCDIGWSDLGSWDDIAKMSEQSSSGEEPLDFDFFNRAETISSNAPGNFVFSTSKKVYGLVEVSDLLLVDTPDALLVTRRGKSQNVRHVVDKLNSLRNQTAKEHLFDVRPWGKYTVLRNENHYKSKVIEIDPHAQISYQSHAKRSEHWIVVRGQGEAIINEVAHPLKAGDAVFIPQGAKHRMRNTGDSVMEFVEVQTGTYFGEDDIVRYQDDYQRV